jgi:hypothetical protein
MTAEHIPDEDSLYRRIHPEQLKPDGEISSAAFKGDETSVDWAKYATPKKTLQGFSHYHLASILAGIPRQRGQAVKHNPTEENHAHSLIIGHKTKSISRFLSRNSILIVRAPATPPQN